MHIGAGADLLDGIGQGLSGLGGGGSSMPKGYNPNSLSGSIDQFARRDQRPVPGDAGAEIGFIRGFKDQGRN
jgi:hypothetical protein